MYIGDTNYPSVQVHIANVYSNRIIPLQGLVSNWY